MKPVAEALAPLAPFAVRLWPSFRNPAWNFAEAAVVLGDMLRVTIDPRKIRTKLTPSCAAVVKGRFFVDGADRLQKDEIDGLYTYQDMMEIAEFGDDYRQTRLFRWMQASLLAGRPVAGRGSIFDSEEKIVAYYRTYLDLYRSMKENGYRYEGDDEICLGIGAGGGIFQVRRGTHRIAAAQLLELPSISARITHIDRKFALAAADGTARTGVTALGRAINRAMEPARA